MGKKVRLTLDLSDRINAMLDELASETGTSKAEVIRDAIRMKEAAEKARKEGRRIGATAKDSDRLEREFLF